MTGVLVLVLLIPLQDFSTHMYKLMKEKLGVTADLPSSSAAQAAGKPADDDAAEDVEDSKAGDKSTDDTDKSEL